MAEEKVVRISAQDNGFGVTINRMAEDAKKAMSEIGLESLFDEADKQFDKIEDKIRSIGDELKNKAKEANEVFDQRAAQGGGNEFYRAGIKTQQDDYNKSSDEAIKKFDKFADELQKKLDKVNKKDPKLTPEALEEQNKQDWRTAFGQIGRNAGNAVGRNIPGVGGGVGNLGEAAGSRLGEAISGVGGTNALMAAGAVAGVVVAVAAAIKMLYGVGMEQWKTDSKVSATFDIDRDNFGTNARGGTAKASDFGLDNKEWKEFILQVGKTRGSAQNVEEIAYNQMSMQRGYGLNEQEVGKFNRYNHQDVTKRDASYIIADILERSEKKGILGVSGSDFSRLPEKLEQVSSIMALQKMNGEEVNSNTAVNLMMEGQRIGGRFGDDRAGEAFGRIDSSIKNPDNPGMKAYIYEMLRKSNPNASYTDIQGMMEGGASKENLQAIMPEINKLPKGEMRRMILQKLTHNWQDAIRLDKSGGIDTDALNNDVISDSDAKKKFGETDVRVERNLAAMDELGKVIKNNLYDFGEKFIARPMNDAMRGAGQGNTVDWMKFVSPTTWMSPGGHDSNVGKRNTVTSKPANN